MPQRISRTTGCLVCAVLLCLLGSCARHAEHTRPLWGDLETFTTMMPGDTTTLTGIRHRLTGDTLVGHTTSGTFAPHLKQAIAMARVDVASSAVGTELEVEVRGRRVAATVVPMPFYKHA